MTLIPCDSGRRSSRCDPGGLALWRGEMFSPNTRPVTRQVFHTVDFAALRLAVEDLTRTFGDRYPNGQHDLARLAEIQSDWPKLLDDLSQNDPDAREQVGEVLAFQRDVLLANPLLDFERLLLIKRKQRLAEARLADELAR